MTAGRPSSLSVCVCTCTLSGSGVCFPCFDKNVVRTPNNLLLWLFIPVALARRLLWPLPLPALLVFSIYFPSQLDGFASPSSCGSKDIYRQGEADGKLLTKKKKKRDNGCWQDGRGRCLTSLEPERWRCLTRSNREQDQEKQLGEKRRL